MNLDGMVRKAGRWIACTGPDSDIVISSRARLARNIHGLPFLARASEEDRKRIVAMVLGAIGKSGREDIEYIELSEADPIDRLMLVERHLISKELAGGDGMRGAAIDEEEVLSLLVNEEDHLRIQAIMPGMALEDAYNRADRLDDDLERHMRFAYSAQYGYLTACPSNVGTGLRASFMVHLPALGFMKQMEKVFQAISKIGLAVRGLYGEGTQALGDFYQISNQISLGKSETGLLDDLVQAIPKIVEYERRTRETWLSEDRNLLEDRVMRALGMLRHARRMSSEEMMDHLSAVRMGVNLGLISGLDIGTVNELFFLTQPAHIQKIAGRRLGPTERDVARADFIRGRIDTPREAC